MTTQGNKIRVACAIQMSQYSLCHHRFYDSTYRNTYMGENYLFGEQDMERKDSVLQVSLMKEVVDRTVNNNRSFH